MEQRRAMLEAEAESLASDGLSKPDSSSDISSSDSDNDFDSLDDLRDSRSSHQSLTPPHHPRRDDS